MYAMKTGGSYASAAETRHARQPRRAAAAQLTASGSRRGSRAIILIGLGVTTFFALRARSYYRANPTG